ncbi:MAG: ubiquinol-cytochrome c reductase iron-sulfur subunit [Sideroxydans sp.]|nr:ubiquinol-cytochrome c reductase iron-sulfur subunit [Sideroxydans sp.]
MSGSDTIDNPERRNFLGKITTVAGVTGAAAACWPFVNSMNPSSDVLAKATTEVDLSNIPPGGEHSVAWQGKPVFVVHRTPEQIKNAESSNGSIDPEADSKRVLKPEWLVVVGICTHLGCVPNRDPEGGWLCPCHGSMYDASGRVIRGPAPKNLEVPTYSFVSDNKILIGKA